MFLSVRNNGATDRPDSQDVARIRADRLINFLLEFFRKLRGHVRLHGSGEPASVDPDCSAPAQYVLSHGLGNHNGLLQRLTHRIKVL